MTRSRKPTYTKKDIARKLSALSGENRRASSAWVDRIFTVLRETMMSANPELRIEIRDFGVFEVKVTKSKPKARNPKSGEIIFVPSRRKTHFKPSKLLRGFLSKPLPGAPGRQA
ncbi:MAG TPA: HU family DNA-binding protein [Bacteroidota bacterium]|nr:HU family DNA-binding protein [Bacteroidota bacterium]